MSSTFEYFEKYKKEKSEEIKETFLFVETSRIQSVGDVEKSETGFYYFNAKFTNGEVLLLLSIACPVEEKMKSKIKLCGITCATSESMILFGIHVSGFGPCYIPIVKLAVKEGEFLL